MKRGGRGRGPGGFRRDDLTSVKYNADEDLDHLQIWPFDFYYLKPGAKARRTKAEGRTPRSAGLLRKMDLSRFAPLSWDDIAHIQLLVVDVWHLCPSLWVSYMSADLGIIYIKQLDLMNFQVSTSFRGFDSRRVSSLSGPALHDRTSYLCSRQNITMKPVQSVDFLWYRYMMRSRNVSLILRSFCNRLLEVRYAA